MGSRHALLCAVAVAALATAGCGDDDNSSDGSAGSTQAPAAEGGGTGAPGAKGEVVTPKDGATVAGKVAAKVKLTNFEIDPAAVGKSPVPGQGHLHFQMDGGKFDD